MVVFYFSSPDEDGWWVVSFGVHNRHGHVFSCAFDSTTEKEKKALWEGSCRIMLFDVSSLTFFSLLLRSFLFVSLLPVHLHGLPVSSVGTARTYMRFGLFLRCDLGCVLHC